MARHNAAELWGQHQGAVPARSGGVVPDASETSVDLRRWARRAPLPASAMLSGGIGLAVIGALGAMLGPAGFFATVLFGSAFTVGGGVAFLGLLKARAKAERVALPPAPSTDISVLTERARRVHAILDRGGSFTFEHLVAELRWTESALLEALVYLKQAGTMIEDLDLDTGQWVYVSQAAALGTDAGGAGALTLEDRQAKRAITEANG